jgi:hypothetical protein
LSAERGRAKLNVANCEDQECAKLNNDSITKQSNKLQVTTSTDRSNAERAKDKQNESTTNFWDQRPWTRILLTWTEFKNVKKYVEQNFNEAMGFVPYKPRKYKSTA